MTVIQLETVYAVVVLNAFFRGGPTAFGAVRVACAVVSGVHDNVGVAITGARVSIVINGERHDPAMRNRRYRHEDSCKKQGSKHRKPPPRAVFGTEYLVASIVSFEPLEPRSLKESRASHRNNDYRRYAK
jgi:hypothetical protein